MKLLQIAPVVLVLFLSCGNRNTVKAPAESSGILSDSVVYNILKDSVVYNPLCDSIYSFKVDILLNGNKDTVINGVEYAYVLILSDKHILAFRKYGEKYGMLQYIEALTDGMPSKLFDNSVNDCEDELYYADFFPSPDNKFVHYCVYYETMNINNEEEVILQFGSGYIYDVEKQENIYSLMEHEVGGSWTYCDQYIANDEILFDPATYE